MKFNIFKCIIKVAAFLSSRFLGIIFFLVVYLNSFDYNNLYSQVPQANDIHGKTKAASHEKKKNDFDSTKTTTKGSFIPVPYIITDQNVGYGAIIALSYLHANKNSAKKDTPPSITALAGGGTSTKSWTMMLLHSHSWNDDRLRYLGALFYMNFNLNFYQFGSIDLTDNPIRINLDGWGTFQRIQFRVKESNFFIGPQFSYARIISSVAKDQDFIIGDTLDTRIFSEDNLSSIGLIADYDNRDNTISPKNGFYAGLEGNYNATWIGSSYDFLETEAYFYAYVPLTKWLYSIYHFDYMHAGDDAPFYLKPFVQLRGAPALRYQGNNTLLLEAQFRAYVYKNWALVAFTGIGTAYDTFSEFSSAEWVYNYGFGARYELAKAFGTRVGLDFAWANQEFGWYVVIGTSF